MINKPLHPTQTSAYWANLAASERSFAHAKRGSRTGSVESIKVHERNAAEYEETAAKLRAAGR